MQLNRVSNCLQVNDCEISWNYFKVSCAYKFIFVYTLDHFNGSQSFIKDSAHNTKVIAGIILLSVSQSAMKWNT